MKAERTDSGSSLRVRYKMAAPKHEVAGVRKIPFSIHCLSKFGKARLPGEVFAHLSSRTFTTPAITDNVKIKRTTEWSK